MADEITNLALGLDLQHYSGGVVGPPGSASDCRDVLFRDDGAVFKHWGWERINTTAFAARVLAHRGFAYKGKNNDPVAIGPNPARVGNYGLADDGAIFTKRIAFYTGGIVLTETQCLSWNPLTGVFDVIALPGGVAIAPNPKPSMLVMNDNVYIVGWADANLRYDPVDRALYVWGWAATPANAGHTGVGAGGALVANAVYRYRLSWIDLYTGEESSLGVEYQQATTAVNRTIVLDNFIAYIGARHFVDLANLTNEDVGIVVYRTGPDDQSYYFLDIVNPGVAAAIVTDNGLAVDFSIKATPVAYIDPPLLNAITEYKTQWYGLSWAANQSRIYYNDFRGENSFLERTRATNYIELPLSDGEVLTAIAKTENGLIPMSNLTSYLVDVKPDVETGRISRTITPTNWTVGCVGPLAWQFFNGSLQWLSDRGPYKWRPGGEPLWIGKMVSPLFIDPDSGLCQLNVVGRLEAEVLYDQDADATRWIFACGASTIPNRHLIQCLASERIAGSPYAGWSLCSAEAGSLDYTSVYRLAVGGVPPDPFDMRGQLTFSVGNYLCRYDPGIQRADVPDQLAPVTGIIQAGSGLNLVVTIGGLFLVGDDMAGMRLEVVHTDGTVDVRGIINNTAVNIVPDAAFSQDPTGGTWYVCGVPSFWRSWVDHGGEPTFHKTLLHLFLGYDRKTTAAGTVMDISVGAGDFPDTVSRAFVADLNAYRAKLMVSRTARFFTYEIANTRPDERFVLTYIKPELSSKGRRFA